MDGLNGEGLLAILREHRNQNIVDDLYLRLVDGRDLDEDILRVQRDLRVFAIDDGWQRTHGPFGVEDDWIHRRVSDDV